MKRSKHAGSNDPRTRGRVSKLSRHLAGPRIPVFSGPRIIELADFARVRAILQAPNAEAVTRRKDKAIVQINLVAHGDDAQKRGRRGNPLSYSYRSETEDNPTNCWALKKLHTSVGDIFRLSVTENLSPRWIADEDAA